MYSFIYYLYITFSSSSAIPWPPPIQAEPIEYLTPLRLISWTRCAVIRDPDAANGCPNAIAPPLTLVFALSRPSSFSTAKY